MKILNRVLYFLICVATAMVSYHLNHSIIWAILAWIFAPVAWCKWLICHQVSISVLKATFSFFLS